MANKLQSKQTALGKKMARMQHDEAEEHRCLVPHLISLVKFDIKSFHLSFTKFY